MGSPLAEPPLEATNLENRAASAPVIDSDTYPLLTNCDREHLPRRSSDGGPEGKNDDEAKLRWPVRQYSASSDPVTRDRRIKRLETFIDKAKQRKTSYREPLRKPSDGTCIRRVRTAPTPIRRRSSPSVSSLLWLARPRSRGSSTPREPTAESLLRRVGHHIKVRAQLQDDLPAKTSSEESLRSLSSAPEVPVAGPSFSSSTTPESNSSQHHHHHCIPSLHLCAYRSPSSTRAHASSSSDHDSPSSSSVASLKSTCADTATTLTDVHVVKVLQSKGNELISPGEATPSPSMHLIESGHGSYHVLWGETPSCHLSTSDVDSMSVGPDEDAPKSPLPTGLDRVNTKLEEWSFAARECTALDKSRSHPHFRSYVEVYQDDDEPQFDMDDDSDAIFMAPPNTERPTPGSSAWDSRRSSEAEGANAHKAPPSSHGRSDSGSFSSDDVSGPGSQHRDDDIYEPPTVPYHLRYSDDFLFTGGYYSPRPNEATAADRRRPEARSLSSLSNTSDMSDNAASLLANHRDSVTLMSERYQDDAEPPVDNPWSHRDSVAIAKDRIRKKHANETGEALVAGVGILKGVGKGGFERTPPLAIPRLQQVTLMGVLSPIPDSSPPNANKWEEAFKGSIDELTERR